VRDATHMRLGPRPQRPRDRRDTVVLAASAAAMWSALALTLFLLPWYSFPVFVFVLWAVLMLLYYRTPLRDAPKQPRKGSRG
jgi:fatty acid desaturase